MNNKILSGNIITDFSEHYMQFVSVVREKIDYKSINIFKRDYSKFSEGIFRDDVSTQNINNHFEDVNDKFNDFYLKLEGCVEINKMIKIRKKLFQRKKRQPNNENNKIQSV